MSGRNRWQDRQGMEEKNGVTKTQRVGLEVRLRIDLGTGSFPSRVSDLQRKAGGGHDFCRKEG